MIFIFKIRPSICFTQIYVNNALSIRRKPRRQFVAETMLTLALCRQKNAVRIKNSSAKQSSGRSNIFFNQLRLCKILDNSFVCFFLRAVKVFVNYSNNQLDGLFLLANQWNSLFIIYLTAVLCCLHRLSLSLIHTLQIEFNEVSKLHAIFKGDNF